MDGNHMVEIVQNLVERILCDAKFDKPAVKEMLMELGWTDWDIEWFNIAWMFEDDYEEE